MLHDQEILSELASVNLAELTALLVDESSNVPE
jgi:hypothetical protein